ncbi:hypothetical protein IscW_ISCW016669 [Ixodes scapularis]|uniref:Uncharacterized protein n=1 Tax=Ixodes scapularis TaxID=6945 RepID=B7P8H8_IXOSC|nr:hypothetical protein IscW_ISCW016669 [Ixodes scapularis]|eukprot:XP_002402047.1 hypothetical protein IscW_ISCW016669 [Ixodes scapularis]
MFNPLGSSVRYLSTNKYSRSPLRSSVRRLPTISTCAISCRVCKLVILNYIVPPTNAVRGATHSFLLDVQTGILHTLLGVQDGSIYSVHILRTVQSRDGSCSDRKVKRQRHEMFSTVKPALDTMACTPAFTLKSIIHCAFNTSIVQ